MSYLVIHIQNIRPGVLNLHCDSGTSNGGSARLGKQHKTARLVLACSFSYYMKETRAISQGFPWG